MIEVRVASDILAHKHLTVGIPCEFPPSSLIQMRTQSLKKVMCGDFPGSLVVKTSPSTAGGEGSIPALRARIPHASWPKGQGLKQKQY